MFTYESKQKIQRKFQSSLSTVGRTIPFFRKIRLDGPQSILKKKILVWANNVEDIVIRIGNKTLLIGKCGIHLKYEYCELSAQNQCEQW